jgi:hypothetical protein
MNHTSLPREGCSNGPHAERAQHQQFWGTINRILDTAADNMKGISDDDFDSAVDAALNTMRPRR